MNKQQIKIETIKHYEGLQSNLYDTLEKYIIYLQKNDRNINWASMRTFASSCNCEITQNTIEDFVGYCLGKGIDNNPTYGQIRSYFSNLYNMEVA